jgi:CheY-like chemotaxis protein
VELHNGRIEVKSVVGQGSRFTVIIPWLKSETAPLLHWASAESTSSSYESDAELNLTSPGKILLVEDNEINIHMLSDYLTSQRYNMILTRSGQQALQIIPEERPDLVLMDIQMPGMDGLEVIRRIRNLPDPRLAKTLIIALTALAMPGDRERCLEAGANYYLSKPVSLNELVSIIKSFLEETP